MLRLESLDDENAEAAQQDLDALADDLRDAGFDDVEIAGFGEPKWTAIRKSAESEFVHVLNVVLSHAENVSIDAILVAVFTWARKKRLAHRGRHGAKPTVSVWVQRADGRDQNVREEPLPEPDESAA